MKPSFELIYSPYMVNIIVITALVKCYFMQPHMCVFWERMILSLKGKVLSKFLCFYQVIAHVSKFVIVRSWWDFFQSWGYICVHNCIALSLCCCRVKKSCFLNMVKKIYYPIRKPGLKPSNQTTWFISPPQPAPQHQLQGIESNRKSNVTATPTKSLSRATRHR